MWLEREIPIHAEDISRITGLSAEGKDVSTKFQNVSKRAKNSGGCDYYNKYETKRGGKGANIDLINNPTVKFSYYLIASKTMRHYTKGECTLDTILVTEHYIQGAQLNWCTFLMNELFEACEDNYRRATRFIYSYLVMAFSMWKWTHPGIRQLAEITHDQPMALKFTPWRVSGDPSTKEVNEEAFSFWYKQMVDVVASQQRVLRDLLDRYSSQIWLGVTHKQTYIKPICVDETTF